MQSKKGSIAECILGTVIGFLISVIAYIFILPFYGIYISIFENMQIVTIFTVISIARQYMLRRIFNNFTIR